MYVSVPNWPNSLFVQFERLRRELDDVFGVSGLPGSIRAVKAIVRVEVPGMRREDFNVELHDDLLMVWGNMQFDREASFGRYRDGVPRIRLPKADAARARCIEVKTA